MRHRRCKRSVYGYGVSFGKSGAIQETDGIRYLCEAGLTVYSNSSFCHTLDIVSHNLSNLEKLLVSCAVLLYAEKRIKKRDFS